MYLINVLLFNEAPGLRALWTDYNTNMNHKHNLNSGTTDRFKHKKKVKITSLEAAICNVALFKSMKDKEFRDTIYISYCVEGVILEAIS